MILVDKWVLRTRRNERRHLDRLGDTLDLFQEVELLDNIVTCSCAEEMGQEVRTSVYKGRARLRSLG